MGATIIGIIGTLLGVVIGGGVNFFINRAQFIREKQWQQKQITQHKLEEICKVVEDINQSYKEIWLDAIQFLEYGKAIEAGSVLPLARLSMLINFYAPELKDTFNLLEECRQLFDKPLVSAIKCVQTDEPTRKQIKRDLSVAYNQIDKVCNSLTAGSAILANKTIL